MCIRTTPLPEVPCGTEHKAPLPGDGGAKIFKEDSVCKQNYSDCLRTRGHTHESDPAEASAEQPLPQQAVVCAYLTLFCLTDLRRHRSCVSKQPAYVTCLIEERQKLMHQETSCSSCTDVLSPMCGPEVCYVEEELPNHRVQHKLSKLMFLDTRGQASGLDNGSVHYFPRQGRTRAKHLNKFKEHSGTPCLLSLLSYDQYGVLRIGPG